MNVSNSPHALARCLRRFIVETNSYSCEAIPSLSPRNVFTCHHHQRFLMLFRRFSSSTVHDLRRESKVNGEKNIEELTSSLKRRLSYVFDKSVARRLANSILSNRDNPKAPILEIAPGIGLMSREFLHQGVEKVIALETEKAFHPYLQLIQDEHSDGRYEFHTWNMLSVHDKFFKRSPRGSYNHEEAEIVNKLSRSAFAEKETPYSIFNIGGSQENHNFVFYISRNLPYEDPILCKGRVEFFFLVHPKFKLCIEEIGPTHSPSSYNKFFNYFHTFVSLLYDITFHDEFGVNDFVPAFSKKNASRKIDVTKRYLVRLQLKSDISVILPLDHHHAFSVFLRNIFRKRNMRIIPVMETLVAGSGLHMLANGFTMMETIADISPDRLLQLYKDMIKWQEYSVSHLKDYMMMKTQGDQMEVENE